MEKMEGIFRGLFIKIFSESKLFMQANFIAVFLFEIWHIVMPARSYMDGEMSLAAMVLMGIGYIILAGIMGIKWGLLYHMTGNTAYIEPVATVPEHRGKGLGRAVVYEAVNRAKERGAKRAIVLSDQDFYKCLGMIKSSEVGTWVRNSK